MDTLSGDITLPCSFLPPFSMGSFLEEKNLLLQEQIVTLGVDLILEGLHGQGKQTGSNRSCIPL